MARDPERIPKVLDAVEDLWKRHPDLRLTQLVIKAAESTDRGQASPWGMDKVQVLNVEDDELLEGLDNLSRILK